LAWRLVRACLRVRVGGAGGSRWVWVYCCCGCCGCLCLELIEGFGQNGAFDRRRRMLLDWEKKTFSEVRKSS
jgi:hypothetical protein